VGARALTRHSAAEGQSRFSDADVMPYGADQIEAIIAAYGIMTPKTKSSRRLIQYGPRENPNKTVGLFDRFFELGDITSALSIHRVQPVS
jgi:hypothetical protein